MTTDECNETVTEEDVADVEILLSSFSPVLALGVSDGIYYIQYNNGPWEEIPASTEDDAITYFEQEKEKLNLEQNTDMDDDEAAINAECNRIWESRIHNKKKEII